MSEGVATDLNGAEHSNLFGYIDRDNVHGLNLAVPEQAKALIKPWSDRDDTTQFAESGVDDQMIIHVPFSQNVRIKSVILKLGRGETTPRHLKLFANYPNIIDFADAENTKPHLDIALLEGETWGCGVPSESGGIYERAHTEPLLRRMPFAWDVLCGAASFL
ncbi:galactose-binding domain-like protein [Chiua virens]|nr:galactose-binding domain-like protein [Chiua virens]